MSERLTEAVKAYDRGKITASQNADPVKLAQATAAATIGILEALEELLERSKGGVL